MHHARLVATVTGTEIEVMGGRESARIDSIVI